MVHKRDSMTPWKTLSRRLAFDASPYLRVFREEVEVAPDHVIPDFRQVELRSFVLVVPVQPDGYVVTMTGYRHGPRRECLSLPGGFIDPGEMPESAARRELVEEAGLTPSRVIGLGDFVDNGNQRGAWLRLPRARLYADSRAASRPDRGRGGQGHDATGGRHGSRCRPV